MRYIAKERGYINRIIEKGEEFDWDGERGSWMEPVDAKGSPKRDKQDAGAKKQGDGKANDDVKDKQVADGKTDGNPANTDVI